MHAHPAGNPFNRSAHADAPERGFGASGRQIEVSDNRTIQQPDDAIAQAKVQSVPDAVMASVSQAEVQQRQ